MEVMNRINCFIFFVLNLVPKLQSSPFYHPTANLSTLWTNGPDSSIYRDGSQVRAILVRQKPNFEIGQSFACGFYCKGGTEDTCKSFVFAVFIVYLNSEGGLLHTTPQVVWSANRNRPVKDNATLELKKDGDLVLTDVDDSLVWSTNTSGRSVVGMNLSETGNLILLDVNNQPVWQTFDHLTDTMLPGQMLRQGQRIIANTTRMNSTEGALYLTITSHGLDAYVASSPPQFYGRVISTLDSINTSSVVVVVYRDGGLVLYVDSDSLAGFGFPSASSSAEQFLRLDFDGHFRVYGWDNKSAMEWKVVYEMVYGESVHGDKLGDCSFPLVCGHYGVCKNKQCTCPKETENYFQYSDRDKPELGCSPLVPLSCQSPQNHMLVTLNDVTYFNYYDENSVVPNMHTVENCKEACLRNCSCKAALFRYYGITSNGSYGITSNGSCLLLSEVFSLFGNENRYNSSAYLKVEVSRPAQPPSPPPSSSLDSGSKGTRTRSVIGVIVGVVFGIFLVMFITWAFLKKTKGSQDGENDDVFDPIPNTTTRLSYEQLRMASLDFSNELGKGGFGSVFKGKLVDGTEVAIKRLDNAGQGEKEFLSEVKTLGSIHHLNLVRLVGFCAEKSHRLLVYDYMTNGSLDQWIFQRSKAKELGWETRCKIVNHVARGLLYLHQGCRQRVIHLDIKPQNILLDANFDAKVADFGLAKLMDRDHSCTMTRMRGTRGYLAPEWLSSVITEKVDVYSFGVVIVEIVCGRMNIDDSQSEESRHLLRMLKHKAEEGRVLDFLRGYNDDGHLNEKEAEKMLHIAMWCLQSDTIRRPSMVEVVKALEGDLEVDDDLDFDFFNPVHEKQRSHDSSAFTSVIPSSSSGPSPSVVHSVESIC